MADSLRFGCFVNGGAELVVCPALFSALAAAGQYFKQRKGELRGFEQVFGG
jgi:hypothetical protein